MMKIYRRLLNALKPKEHKELTPEEKKKCEEEKKECEKDKKSAKMSRTYRVFHKFSQMCGYF